MLIEKTIYFLQILVISVKFYWIFITRTQTSKFHILFEQTKLLTHKNAQSTRSYAYIQNILSLKKSVSLSVEYQTEPWTLEIAQILAC